MSGNFRNRKIVGNYVACNFRKKSESAGNCASRNFNRRSFNILEILCPTISIDALKSDLKKKCIAHVL